MKMLVERLKPAKVKTALDVGWSADALEAQAFAYLAVRSLKGLPLTFPATTGVPRAADRRHHRAVGNLSRSDIRRLMLMRVRANAAVVEAQSCCEHCLRKRETLMLAFGCRAVAYFPTSAWAGAGAVAGVSRFFVTWHFASPLHNSYNTCPGTAGLLIAHQGLGFQAAIAAGRGFIERGIVGGDRPLLAGLGNHDVFRLSRTGNRRPSTYASSHSSLEAMLSFRLEFRSRVLMRFRSPRALWTSELRQIAPNIAATANELKNTCRAAKRNIIVLLVADAAAAIPHSSLGSLDQCAKDIASTSTFSDQLDRRQIERVTPGRGGGDDAPRRRNSS